MTGLPDAHLASIDEAKITQYLLAAGHPAGRAKATFFRRFGYSADRWGELRDNCSLTRRLRYSLQPNKPHLE